MKADEVAERAKPRHGLYVLDAEHKTLLTVENTASYVKHCVYIPGMDDWVTEIQGLPEKLKQTKQWKISEYNSVQY